MHYKSISYFSSIGNYTCGLISIKSKESSLKPRSCQKSLVRHMLMCCSSMEEPVYADCLSESVFQRGVPGLMSRVIVEIRKPSVLYQLSLT